MDPYAEREKIREQRRKLIDGIKYGTDENVDHGALVSEPGGEPEVGRNDGSENGGTAPVGGQIDLESARQQYRGLTGQLASAKWTADQIAEKIEQWRKENAPPAAAGAGVGTGQTGPLTTEDANEKEAQIDEAAAKRAKELADAAEADKAPAGDKPKTEKK